ncbi:MAG: hypothetical protein ABSA02_04565 [Trebonia sp.]
MADTISGAWKWLSTQLCFRMLERQKGIAVDVSIRIVDGDVEVIQSLADWLAAERELRGRVQTIDGSIREGQLGAVTEMITVALGSGGAGTVLASSLITWLKARPTRAKLIVKSGDRLVELDIQTMQDVRPLLEQMLGAVAEN